MLPVDVRYSPVSGRRSNVGLRLQRPKSGPTADSFQSFSCAQLAAFHELGSKVMCFAFGTSLASRSCAYFCAAM
jgi:hypothetical protein